MVVKWAREYPVLDTAEEAEISDRVEIDIIILVAERSMHHVLLNNLMILGGPGTVV